jgi:hypothetical protein
MQVRKIHGRHAIWIIYRVRTSHILVSCDSTRVGQLCHNDRGFADASMNPETILSLLKRGSDADDSLKGLEGGTTTAVTICCKAKADEGSRKMAMLDVQIDAAIRVGSIVFSTCELLQCPLKAWYVTEALDKP